MLNTFSCTYLPFVYFLSEISVQVFLPFSKWIFLLLTSDISLYIPDTCLLSAIVLQSIACPFILLT